MEVEGGHDNKGWVLLSEFIGTAILCAAINYSNETSPKAGYAAPITLFAIIMCIGSVSGGHVNPAVSTAVFIYLPNKLKNFGYYFMIIMTQFLGGFAGCCLSGLISLGGSYTVK